MNPVIGYESNDLKLILVDRDHPFRPAPAKDKALIEAKRGKFALCNHPNEWQVFQLVVDSACGAVVTSVTCEGLGEKDGFTCLSTEGVDSSGHDFLKPLTVNADEPWPMWCLVKLSEAGKRDLTLNVTVCGKTCRVPLSVSAFGNADPDEGTTDKDKLSRLIWLNSRRGLSNDIPAPFTPIVRKNSTLSILGRDIELNGFGMPQQIYTHFTGNNSELTDEGRGILAAPITYVVKKNGKAVAVSPVFLRFDEEAPHVVTWTAESAGEGMTMRVEGCLEFDGTLTVNAYLRTAEEELYTVELEHQPEAVYGGLFIGLGVQGCKTPASYEWKWDAEKRQDAYWIGGVNGGLVMRPRDPNMEQAYVNLYYHHGPRNLPVNWVNGGKGGFELKDGVCHYMSGEIPLGKAEKLFGVEMMISPFKPVDQKKHFGTHYYHGGPYKEEKWPAHAAENGCTHINYHHGNDGYPFINYPMYDDRTFHKLIAEAHGYGIGVKPYYTVRELTSRLPEFWAFRSLKQEIFPKPTYVFDGITFQGGTDPFIKDNLEGEVIPAWKHVFSDGPYKGLTDPALITNSMSRLVNFYVEGLDYMCGKWGIDGIYIDDVGYDRTIMRRVRRVLDAHKKGSLIDLHTWNHFEDEMGAGWGHNVLLYAQLMPYLDSLWLGESFDYDNTSAEYILVEISGLPFGLMGEMLQDGGNTWRGMLYGMTSRFPYQDKSPVRIWKLRERFGFDNVTMYGFWDKKLTVTSGCDAVKCTVYEHESKEKMLICFANFDKETAVFKPQGLPDGWCVFLPEVDGLQSESVYSGEELRIEPTQGVILWAEKV